MDEKMNVKSRIIMFLPELKENVQQNKLNEMLVVFIMNRKLRQS